MNADKVLNEVLRRYASLAMFEDFPIDSPTSPGMDGDTPFHMAAFDGDVEALRLMIPYVSDLNFPGGIGNAALHYSVMNGKLDATTMLIASGANLDAENDYGDTPRKLMMQMPVFKELISQFCVAKRR